MSEHVQTNMSKRVQIKYDTNCYDSCDSQTCLTMLKYVWTCSDSIWYELLWFSNMSEHVPTCLNMFRFNMIRIDTMKTWWNTLKLSKWHKKFFFCTEKRFLGSLRASRAIENSLAQLWKNIYAHKYGTRQPYRYKWHWKWIG